MYQVKSGKAYIAGEFTNALTGMEFSVSNPATGEALINVVDCGAADAEKAILAAHEAFSAWSGMLAIERANILHKWADLIEQNHEKLAQLMTTEQGKPLKEAKGEIAGGIMMVRWSAEEGRRTRGDTLQRFKQGTDVQVVRQAYGVVAAITPWNFPHSMITRKVAPALAAGCTVVLKPAADTPLSALALAELAHEAGIPAGVLNIVTSDKHTADIGTVLCTHPKVAKISFTGSTPVGKLLMGLAAGGVKKLSLELGGNAPFIIFDDADLQSAVEGVTSSKFRNGGQTCVCANRIFVQKNIADKFTEMLKTRIGKLKQGNGLDADTDIGPLINEKAIEKVKRHVADAVKSGAKLVAGGDTAAAGPLFMQPTLLTGLNKDMCIFREETFGPVAGIFTFDTEEEVIKLANETEYGLAAYFYARDIGRVHRVSRALDFGMVAVNEAALANEGIPFGGIKESGFGREGSYYGIEEFTYPKYVLTGDLNQ